MEHASPLRCSGIEIDGGCVARAGVGVRGSDGYYATEVAWVSGVVYPSGEEM